MTLYATPPVATVMLFCPAHVPVPATLPAVGWSTVDAYGPPATGTAKMTPPLALIRPV
jgi:hypothetical protein